VKNTKTISESGFVIFGGTTIIWYGLDFCRSMSTSFKLLRGLATGKTSKMSIPASEAAETSEIGLHCGCAGSVESETMT
jgi:hypothetical protein